MSDTTPVTIASSAPYEGGIDMAKLEETLEYIRPAVQADGGDLVLLGADDGRVSIQMVGACGGCPLSGAKCPYGGSKRLAGISKSDR